MDYEKELGGLITGSVKTDYVSRRKVSHDASVFELLPDVVVAPKDTADVERLVRFVTDHKHLYPSLSITPRSAGTDMSGGAIGGSIVVSMTDHFSTITSLDRTVLRVQPGTYMRDIDPYLSRHDLRLGSVPASRAINTIGGMVGNNSGGEQSLRYGSTARWVRELTVVLADGKAHRIKPLTKRQLDVIMKKSDFLSRLYRQTYELIETHYDVIKNARPHVTKNSMGYNLWDVWDRDTQLFDPTQLFTGSQGTLGVITDIAIEAVDEPKHSGLLLAYLPSITKLGAIIQTVLRHQPSAFEGFDDITFGLGIRYFNTFRKKLGNRAWLAQQKRLLATTARFNGHLPNILLMIEFEGADRHEVYRKIEALAVDLKPFSIDMDIEADERSSAPFWQIRRAALTLLRNQVKHKYAAPFIDDMTVPVDKITEFLPQLRRVIRRHRLPATVQGHFGDGNFHIIPLMDMTKPSDHVKLEKVMRELIPIVVSYRGTMAGEHNDGMIRGPWLPAVFGDDAYQLFRHVKELYDPHYIFNPHKKTDASWDFSMDHIRSDNNSW